jgi:hypothetical protein
MPSNPYDEVLYEGHPFAQTHPDRLATLGRLFGMTPAPPDSCRYLELGCGDGANLLPMAYTLPDSAFAGLDAGARGIEIGCALAQEAGVRNVDLRCVDILEAGPWLGRFDYIVAHGVYSWTPAAVQEKILSLCGELLNEQGVAYVSYDAYPGAHLRDMIGGMLQHHARRFSDPRQQIEQAQAMLSFLGGARATSDAYTLMLRQEVERVAARRPASIFHDELSPHHSPVYFRDFVAQASRHGLQYLGEADFSEMQDIGQPPETLAILRQLAPDLIEREQYLDFLKCRRFRQTPLCRSEVPLRRAIEAARMREFFVSATSPAAEGEAPLTSHPLAEKLVSALRDAWPGALSFDDLASATAGDPELLADLVLAHYAVGRVQLRTTPPRFAPSVSAHPRAGALARLQAARGEFVTNLCHAPVRFEDEPWRLLLQLLDGARDRARIEEELRAAGVDTEGLDGRLERLAGLALLEA